MINEYEVGSAFQTKDRSVLENCIKKEFVLAFDQKLPWSYYDYWIESTIYCG